MLMAVWFAQDEIEAGSWYGGALARPGISSTGEKPFAPCFHDCKVAPQCIPIALKRKAWLVTCRRTRAHRRVSL